MQASPQRKGDDIADRLLGLAAGVIKLLPLLEKQPGANNLALAARAVRPCWRREL